MKEPAITEPARTRHDNVVSGPRVIGQARPDIFIRQAEPKIFELCWPDSPIIFFLFLKKLFRLKNGMFIPYLINLNYINGIYMVEKEKKYVN